MTYDFNKDLDYGKRGQDFALKIIQKKYPKAYQSEGNVKGWDIYVPEKDIFIEVKTDRKSKDTENVAIECSYKDRPSGIMATIAHYWFIIFWDENWKYGIIKNTDLLSLCKRSDVIPAGDGAMCHLIPKRVLKQASSSLHDIRDSVS